MTNVLIAGKHFKDIFRFLQKADPQLNISIADTDELAKGIQKADVVIPTMEMISQELIEQAPRLKLIHQWGAGLEGVDQIAATSRKIYVANVPTQGTGNAESCAEWCIMAAIAISRQCIQVQHQVRTGKEWGSPSGMALFGKTAGIVGFGGIGKALHSRLKAFGMRTLVVKRDSNQGIEPELPEWVGRMDQLNELLKQADYLFIAVPLTSDTRGLIDWNELIRMKPGSYIINPARGAVIEEGALLKALNEKEIAGAALDVFWKEPVSPNNPIIQHKNTLVTPHIAGVTDISYQNIAERLVANIHRVMSGRPPENWANPNFKKTQSPS